MPPHTHKRGTVLKILLQKDIRSGYIDESIPGKDTCIFYTSESTSHSGSHNQQFPSSVESQPLNDSGVQPLIEDKTFLFIVDNDGKS